MSYSTGLKKYNKMNQKVVCKICKKVMSAYGYPAHRAMHIRKKEYTLYLDK